MLRLLQLIDVLYNESGKVNLNYASKEYLEMIVTIHQPEHMPWLGFFHKIAQADVYVLLDNVQFTKNNWQNRNRFIDRYGKLFWLSVPVIMKGHTNKLFKDMLIANNLNWKRKYWGRLFDAYCKHKYFKVYESELYNILVSSDYEFLFDLNYEIIQFFCRQLKINTKIIRASALNVHGKQSALLAMICTELGASVYLSGPSGRDYLDVSLFKNNNIDVQFHHFINQKYTMMDGHNLSTLDLLFNHGDDSRSIIGI